MSFTRPGAPISLGPLPGKPASITDMVLDAVQQAIVDKALAPGQRISETALAESLQVSKTPVREALWRLRRIGLVEQGPHGLQVVVPAPSTVRHAYELRSGVEWIAGSLAASRGSDASLREIAQLAGRSMASVRAQDAQGFRTHDADFHRAIARASGNPMVESAVLDALALTRALRDRDVPGLGDSAACAQDHLDIAEALAARSAQRAAERLSRHIAHVLSVILGDESGG